VPHVLDAVADGRVERERINAPMIRQIRGYQDAALTARLETVLGKTAPASPNIARWKQSLTPAALAQADKASGRAVFQLACAACHKLHGQGGTIGPDLTGAARDNLDYLLENIVTPSAVVADEFRQVTLTLRDGRVLAGNVKGRTAQTLQLQTPAELLTLELAEIVKEEKSALSLMPEGLLEVLDPAKARDLIAYLMAKDLPPEGNAAAK
jgi:putative heme-binding domain-containing protein